MLNKCKHLVYRVWMRHLHYTHNLDGEPPPPVVKPSKKGPHTMDATISNLAEDLGVTKLPAIAVIHSVDRYKLYQQLRGEDVDRAIEAECEKRLVLDEDF